MNSQVSLVRRLIQVGLVAALLLTFNGVQWGASTKAHASTNQFHGVNWADPNDNFGSGPIVPVGLSASDNYSDTYKKSNAILTGFKSLGSNTVRLGINPATTSGGWWSSYVGAFDAATDLGMNVIIAPWLQNGTIGDDTTAFYNMWNVVINAYSSKSNFYFEIMNEPWAYTASVEADVASTWVDTYSGVPRGRILVPGAGANQDLCTVGGDPRLSGTLLSFHVYSIFGEHHPNQYSWATSFKDRLCGHGDRAVLTEFGVPMNTGVNYTCPQDPYADSPNNVAYLCALTDTVRQLGMGSVLWVGLKGTDQTQGPGPCEGASCAIASLAGNGNNPSLSITNQSALDRIQFGWGGTGGGTTEGPTSTFTTSAGMCLSTANGNQVNATPVQIAGCNQSFNQYWTYTAAKQLTSYGGTKCLDAYFGQTAPGTPVQIYDCNGGTNQQWNINDNGTITGVQSGLCLDVTGGVFKTGVPVQLFTCNGGNNQQWKRP